MARETFNKLLGYGASVLEAILGSAKNPDGTDYTLPVSVSGAVTVSQAGAANLAQGQATAGNASGQLVAARATRRSVTVRNTDAANSCYIGTGTVSAANGFLLKAGESISLDTVAAVNGIRATADVVVAFIETYD